MTDTPLDLDDALRAMLDDTRPLTRHATVPVAAALGRVLARAVDAPRSLPPFPASAMDGYALRSSDVGGAPPFRLRVAGTSYAGHPFTGPTPDGACVRIFTGAALPADLDAVVIQEDCDREGEQVVVRTPVAAGDYVRPTGHDVSEGSRLLDAGRRLDPFDLGWLTACGLSEVVVTAQPRIGIFSTGDELLDPGATPGPGQIFDANRTVLQQLLAALPVETVDYGIVPDDPARIRSLLESIDQECDVVVTSGGVSVGDADWVREVVQELGALRLWKLNLKPGKPLAYGRLRQAAFFGLPGNPVSTIVTALLLLRPVLARLCGTTPTPPLRVAARLRGELHHRPGREEYQRGTLAGDATDLTVTVTGDQSSNRLASFAAANCLIRVPGPAADLQDGTTVEVLPFDGLL